MHRLTEEDYRGFSEAIRKRKRGPILVNMADRLIVVLTMVAYPMLLCYCYFYERGILPRTILVPAFSFAAVSIFRHFYDRKRPYELMDFDPVIKRDGQGHSMPSRHVFSIFMIAMCFFQVDVSLGFTFCIMGFALAFIRVYGGVHYPSDVLAGAVAAICMGAFGFWVF